MVASKNGLAVIQKGISLLTDAKRAIASAAPIPALKQIRDQSEAIRALSKKYDLELEVTNLAAESKLRTERAIGKALDDMKRNGQRAGQGGDQKSKLHDATLKLDDLGIEKTEAHRWQKIAQIPEEKFEEHIEHVKTERREITSADALRLAKKCEQNGSSNDLQNGHSALAVFQHSDLFLDWLESVRARTDGILNQFGSLEGLLKEPGWDHTRDGLIHPMLAGLAKTVVAFEKEFAKWRKSANKT